MGMKAFYLLFFFPVLSWACSNADPSRAVIFIDTNNNIKEIEAAQNGACARGETIIIIPKNYLRMNEIKERINKTVTDNQNCVEPKCSAATKSELEKLEKEAKADNLRTLAKQPPVSEQLNQELKKLQKKDAILTSFIISGHDGGGFYTGWNSRTNRAEISKVLDQYPDVNKISSLLLLGCYSGVRKEMNNWKSVFPDIRLIAGYDAAAPLGQRPYGHKYISDTLANEAELLIFQDDKKAMTKHLKETVSALSQLNASLYLRPYCEDENTELFFGHTDPLDKNVKRLVDYNENSCDEKVNKKLKEIETILKYDYDTGDLDPRIEENEEQMAKFYQFTRQYEHCINAYDEDINVDINKIFNLLFFENEAVSFAKYYEKEITKVEEIINESDYLKRKIWAPTSDRVKSKSYKEILKNIHSIHDLLSSSGLLPDQREALRFTAAAMTKHLKHFENPFSWFEVEDKISDPPTREHLKLPK